MDYTKMLMTGAAAALLTVSGFAADAKAKPAAKAAAKPAAKTAAVKAAPKVDPFSALHCIGKITGKTSDPDVLDEIFRNFCIGK